MKNYSFSEGNAYKPQNEPKEAERIYMSYICIINGMIKIEAVVRKWGNSVGVIIPKDAVEKEALKPDQRINITITKKEFTRVKDIFGKIKFKEPTEKMMRETDSELDSEL